MNGATDELGLLLEAIFERCHYEFRGYAIRSLERRVAAALVHFGCASIAELHAMLHDAASFTRLLRFLTVRVSDLFRDPAYFLALREKVVPYLRTFPSLKVWIAGCATGEEAYSMAILFAEEGILERTLFYATDIVPESLRVAEEGVYDIDRFARFGESYLAAGGRRSLADYYTASGSSGVFDPSLRRAILFSDHSLTTDSAFAEVELVSCRNVLIYFGKALQDRAIGVMRESLRRRGFLGLGSKETLSLSAHAAAFEAVARSERIYRAV